MIVEFAGVPGSGKTLAAKALTDLLNRAGIPATRYLGSGEYTAEPGLHRASPREKRREQLLSPLTSPALTFALTVQVRSVRDVRRASMLMRRNRFVRRIVDEPGVKVLDEGPLHKAASEGLHPVRNAPKVARLLPAPELLIIMSMDLRESLERLRERTRGQSRLAGLDDEQALAAMREYTRCVWSMAAELDVPMFEVDGRDGPGPDVVEEIRKRTADSLDGRRCV